MELSRRLRTVAEAVSPGNRVADIGTDHGYVPIWLIEEGRIPEAIASDVREGPLARAETHIRQKHLEKRIRTRLGSGLDNIAPEEVDTVIMAGMGGSLICRLLEERSIFFQEKKELVLQPQSEWFKVRHILHDHGYRIDREWMLCEDGHYYVIIRGQPGQEAYESEWDYLCGKYLLDRRDPVLVEYLTLTCDKKEKIIRTILEKDSGRQAGEGRLSVLRQEVDWIGKYLRKETGNGSRRTPSDKG